MDSASPALGVTIFAVSHAKYMVGVALALAFHPPLVGMLIATAGALSGTLLWVFAGEGLRRGARHISQRLLGRGRLSARPRSLFTRRNRLLVKLRRRKALVVIAFLTPVFLSMPLGCALALAFESRPRRVVLTVWSAVLLWSALCWGAGSLILEVVDGPPVGAHDGGPIE